MIASIKIYIYKQKQSLFSRIYLKSTFNVGEISSIRHSEIVLPLPHSPPKNVYTMMPGTNESGTLFFLYMLVKGHISGVELLEK
jgi:hypothetical protein